MRNRRQRMMRSLPVLLAVGVAAAGFVRVDAAAQAAPTLVCAPQQATNNVDTDHTMTCDLTSGQTAISGAEIDGEILFGSAHDGDGTTSPPDFSAVTNSAGRATFTYRASTTGTDTICFWRDSDQIDDNIDEGNLQCTEDVNTDRVTKTWVTPEPTPTPTPTPTPSFLLTVSASGDGLGTVTSTPAGIDCGADCSENYAQSTEVTLSAEGNVYSEFSGWDGACTSTTGMCVVTMSESRSVDANFTARRITSPVAASWLVGGRTRVKQLEVREVPNEAKVQVRCNGRGCAFSKKTAKAAGTIDPTVGLKGFFKGRRLRVGTTIEIRVTAPNAIGKLVHYEVRRNKVPIRTIKCLPPGTRGPQAC